MKRKTSPTGAGLVVIVTTVLGWLGCDGLSRVADQTADLLNQPQVQEMADPAIASASPQAGDDAASATSGTLDDSQPAARNVAWNGVSSSSYASQNVAVSYRPYITIGTFNIQVFGKSKVSDRNVLNYLVDIARKFDLLAIQEIRDAEQVALPYFVDALNAGGAHYQYLLGPPETDAVSKEQIAFIFRSDRVAPVGQAFVAPDPQRRMSRNPYVASFQCRQVDQRPPFTFTLVAVHTSQQAVALELEAIADILPMIRRVATEDDVILLGSLNAPPNRFGRLGQIPNQMALIASNVPTNTAKTECYDNMVLDHLATAEFTQQYGVFDVASYYGLTKEQAVLISDHLPVWAMFSIYEANQNFAAQGFLLGR